MPSSLHDARGAGADAAGTPRRRRGQRRIELPLPDDVAEVVVDARRRCSSCRSRSTSARTASRRSPSRPGRDRARRAAGCRASTVHCSSKPGFDSACTEILSSVRTHDVRCASPSAVSHCEPPRPTCANARLPASDARHADDHQTLRAHHVPPPTVRCRSNRGRRRTSR